MTGIRAQFLHRLTASEDFAKRSPKAAYRWWKPLASLSALAVLALAGCAGEPPVPGEWPQFRGPEGTGVSSAEGLPLHWNEEGEGIRWQVEVPDKGISSPIVSGGRVFLTSEEQQGEDTALKVLSFDLKTGAQQWQTTLFSRGREEFPPRSIDNSPAGPTPVADGEFVYVYFGSHLAALDYRGKVVWLEEIDPRYLQEVWYGASSSLVLVGDKIIVFRDREKAEEELHGWIAAFDKKTGARVWKKQWKDTCCSYTTPLVLAREGGTELLVSMAGRIMSYDPDTGEVLWRKEMLTEQPVASPVIWEDLICVSSGAHFNKGMACWRMKAKRGKRPQELWKGGKAIPETASPVLLNGLLFTVTERGIMSAHNAETGKAQWRKRLSGDAQVYHASLVAGDGKVYVTSMGGSVSVIAAESRFKVLAENQLPAEGVVATPAIADGCLVVRTSAHLMCVEGTGTEGEPEAVAPASSGA